MIVKGAESTEHERLRMTLAVWFRRNGWSNVKSPADAVGDMEPDAQGDHNGKRIYREAKLCGDFPATDTKDQLVKYVHGLPTDYKLILAVPTGCQPAVRQTIDTWGLGDGIQLIGF